MKRSTFFLATTTGLLAVTAIFAANFHKFALQKNGYFSSAVRLHGCTNAVSGLFTKDDGSVPVAFTKYQAGHNNCQGQPLFSSPDYE